MDPLLRRQGQLSFERTVEQALDDALAATFPCSDPIAVTCLNDRDRDRDRSGPSHGVDRNEGAIHESGRLEGTRVASFRDKENDMNQRQQSDRSPNESEQRDGDSNEEQVAGNAIHDPARQSRRQDMPDEEQSSEGQEMRGSAPSHEPDRSHQPHRDDHRSNQDWGAASQSGKRQGA